MNNRLVQFLAAENISQSQFADTIEVARASVSHIIAGRNKPGWDFLNSMLKHYPNLNIEWLLNGTGKMYKTTAVETVAEKSQQKPEPIPDLFSNPEVPMSNPGSDYDKISNSSSTTSRESKISDNIRIRTGIRSAENVNNMDNSPSLKGQQVDNQHKISKIVVFYDDNTFTEIL